MQSVDSDICCKIALLGLALHVVYLLHQTGINPLPHLALEAHLQGAIMCYYPAEYRLGQHCLRVIREQTQTDLSESEAAFIALHIVNAELNTNMTDM